jgi:hypothetical protein
MISYHSCYYLLNILCTIFNHFHFFPENATHSVRTEKGTLSQEMTFSQRRQWVCLIPPPPPICSMPLPHDIPLGWPAKFRETKFREMFREIFISHFAKFSNDFREISQNKIYENITKFRESDLTKLYRNKFCLLFTA